MTGEQVMMALLTTTENPMTKEDAKAALSSLPARVLDSVKRSKGQAINLAIRIKAGCLQSSPSPASFRDGL